MDFKFNSIYRSVLSKENDIHFITYGDKNYEKARKRLVKQAIDFNEFKSVKGYSRNDITNEFHSKYQNILKHKRGGGYWIWKYDIIKQSLEKIKENDFLIYIDAGCHLNNQAKKRFHEYIKLFEESKYGMISFQMHNQEEYKWTTKEIFEYFKISKTSNIFQSGQYMSTVLIMRKNKHLRLYIDEFEKCVNYDNKLITDEYNSNQNDYFKDNRHDQSISSIIRKKIGSIVVNRDESWKPPFGTGESLEYPFWARRTRN